VPCGRVRVSLATLSIKPRLRSINEDNLGKYALVKEDSKRVVLGERFEASLEEIAEYLS
jgi:hypothetical protein